MFDLIVRKATLPDGRAVSTSRSRAAASPRSSRMRCSPPRGPASDSEGGAANRYTDRRFP
jgi:hypothetical protein